MYIYIYICSGVARTNETSTMERFCENSLKPLTISEKKPHIGCLIGSSHATDEQIVCYAVF